MPSSKIEHTIVPVRKYHFLLLVASKNTGPVLCFAFLVEKNAIALWGFGWFPTQYYSTTGVLYIKKTVDYATQISEIQKARVADLTNPGKPAKSWSLLLDPQHAFLIFFTSEQKRVVRIKSTDARNIQEAPHQCQREKYSTTKRRNMKILLFCFGERRIIALRGRPWEAS